jgi:hypothetical protein
MADRIGIAAIPCGPAWADEPIASVYAKARDMNGDVVE